MAVIAGVRYTDSDTTNNAIDMSDTLGFMAPFDVPLLSRVGKSSLSTPWVSIKHEWLESGLRSLDSAVADTGDLNNTTDPVTFNVTATEGTKFRVGDVIRVEAELMLVTGVSTDDITVSRAYGGSTNAAHAATPAVYIIGNVTKQDAAVGAARTTGKTALYNYTQMMEDSITVTTTEESIKKYVEQNTMDAQLRDAMRVWWQMWERTLLFGRKVATTNAVAGAMDGILVRLTSHAYAKAGAYLVEDHILTALNDIWTSGGSGNLTAFLGSFQKRRVNQFLDGYRTTNKTDAVAGTTVNTYHSDFGDCTFVLDRNMPSDTVLIVDLDRIGFGPLSNNGVSHATRAIPIPITTGTKRTMQILGQYTSETRNEAAHAKITGLATS